MTRVNTNIGALNALKSLSDVNSRLSIAQLRLATGKRINSAADDAAGYSIAKKFNVRTEGLGQAVNNIGSAKNVISVAEGHLSNILDVLTQMKTKAVQGADDSLGVAERRVISTELLSLISQIDLDVIQATWNGRPLLVGSTSIEGNGDSIFNFQIGAGNSPTEDTLSFNLFKTSNVLFGAEGLGFPGNIGFTAYKLNLTVTGIALSESFDKAGFKYPPRGSVTINGEVFNLSNYPTVQSFMDAINSNPATQVEMTYDIYNDRFIINNLNPISNVDISETGTEFVSGTGNAVINGFFTQSRFEMGTLSGMTRTKSIAPSWFTGTSIDVDVPNINITSGSAKNFIGKIDNAIKDVSTALSYIGSTINRLTYQEKSLTTAKINTEAAKSRIEDADMASEQLQSTKLQIIQQTASAMLAQANTSPQAIMSLFK